MNGFTHIDEGGRAAMVEVGDKPPTRREAVAEGFVAVAPATLALIRADGLGKGDVLGVARLAGIMGAKRTADLIPLCHPLALTGVRVELACDEARGGVAIRATARVTGPTGVEMEALTAVSVAALTLYDMCKAVDPGMEIGGIRLVSKTGGRSARGAPPSPSA